MSEESNVKRLPKRSEVPQELTWALETIYPTVDAWEADFQRVKSLIPEIAAFKGKLGKNGKTLLAACQKSDEASMLLGKLYVYANMRSHEDTKNTLYKGLADRVATLSMELSVASSYVSNELLAIGAKRIAGMLRRNKELRVYKRELELVERGRPHILSDAEEQLLSGISEMSRTPSDVYELFTNADMPLPVLKNEKGEPVQLSHGNYSADFLDSQDAETRKRGFEGMMGAYRSYINTIAGLYAAQVKQNVFYARIRKHPSALAHALKSINAPVSVYTGLISTVHANLDKLNRYLRLRKRAMGVSELHMYDLYVPLVSEVDYKVDFAKACEVVLEALAPLGADYVETLRQGFKSRWCDVLENENKRSGAYSWGSYGTQPFMLLNFQGRLDDVSTLAHEAGHSMHSFYTRKHQPYPYANYTLFVAEVASIFNEALLTHHLLKNADNRAFKMYVINQALEGFRGTLYRQTLFAEFEMLVHEAAESGKALTPEFLNGLYKGLVTKYYGAEVVIDDAIEVEWARIPHFFDSFYVYQYATGISTAESLASQVLTEGAPAVERYLNFLKSGSSEDSLDLLKKAGVDLTTPEPIQQALNRFDAYLDQFEALLDEADKEKAAAAASTQKKQG